MTTEGDGTLHVNDADFVRWLDTELAEPDRFTHETHVSGCAACSARQAAWARRATRVSNLLREIDLPTPTTGLRIAVVPRLEPVAIRWRIAAVVTLALAGAAAVPPVRAWIVEAAKTAWARVWVPTGGRSHQGPIDAAESGAVSFVPTGPALTIRVPARANARLTIEVVEGERVTAEASRGRPVPGLLVFPNELRIGADADSVADYVVRVPVRLEVVRIVIGGAREEVFQPSVPGERRTFGLRPPGAP